MIGSLPEGRASLAPSFSSVSSVGGSVGDMLVARTVTREAQSVSLTSFAAVTTDWRHSNCEVGGNN